MKRIVSSVLIATLMSGCSANNSEEPPQQHPVDVTTVAPLAVWEHGPSGLHTPISKVDGPLNDSPVPHEFSHSPQGAVLAAITAQIWMAGASDQLWPNVAQFLLEPGQGRDQWSQARALMSVKGVVDNPPEFVGFSFTEYSPVRAVVVLATRWPDESLTAYPVQLSHDTGQWRVVVPPQNAAPDLEKISDSDLARFVSFGPGASKEKVK